MLRFLLVLRALRRRLREFLRESIDVSTVLDDGFLGLRADRLAVLCELKKLRFHAAVDEVFGLADVGCEFFLEFVDLRFLGRELFLLRRAVELELADATGRGDSLLVHLVLECETLREYLFDLDCPVLLREVLLRALYLRFQQVVLEAELLVFFLGYEGI